MYRKIKNRLFSGIYREIKHLQDKVETSNILLGRQLSLANSNRKIERLEDSEFKVFSQWGDDGIIQFLASSLNLPDNICRFIEFGVENYTEANTRFLLMNNNWSGLVLDGSEANIQYIKNDPIYWRHDLTAVREFVNAENINAILEGHGFSGVIGLLHIDIDGNDYWVWKAIEAVDPIIAVIEYNSLFGYERAITVPYDPAFIRTEAHYTNLYAGASLPALCRLGNQKDYSFIGCNSAGNNAYFMKTKYLEVSSIRPLTIEEGYTTSKFREARDENGQLLYLSRDKAADLIKGLPVWNVDNENIEEF